MEYNITAPNSSLDLTSLTFSEEHKHDVVKAISEYMDSNMHCYISLSVCLTGIVMNVLTLLVLSQKCMRSPTNLLLGSISVADLLTIVMYTLKLFVITVDPMMDKTQDFAYYKLVFAHVSLLSHTTSIWLTVCLCVFRCLIVLSRNGKKYTEIRQTVITVAGVVGAATLLVLPGFTLLRVHSTPYLDLCNISIKCTEETAELWYVNIGRINATEREREIAHNTYNVQMWIVAVFGKILPCLLVAVMCSMLVHKLTQVDNKHRAMKVNVLGKKVSSLSRASEGCREESEPCILAKGTTVGSHMSEISKCVDGSTKARRSQSNRTTVMLLVVVFTVFITEFPIAILLLLSQALGTEFFDHIYLRLAGLFDILIILKSSGNFLIYCSMSKQFRSTFASLFCSRCVTIRDHTSRRKANSNASTYHLRKEADRTGDTYV